MSQSIGRSSRIPKPTEGIRHHVVGEEIGLGGDRLGEESDDLQMKRVSGRTKEASALSIDLFLPSTSLSISIDLTISLD